MKSARLALFIGTLLLSACAPRSNTPRIQGIWSPQVGSGAVYNLNSKDKEPLQLQYAIVGKEGNLYWLESTVAETRTKMLFDANTGKAERMFVQSPGNPAMDMTQMMKIGQSFVSSQAQQMADTSIEHSGKLIGKEALTTPAGKFFTSHYQSTVEGEITDVWISETVKPYGLVRMKMGNGDSMELVKVLNHVTSQIPTLPN